MNTSFQIMVLEINALVYIICQILCVFCNNIVEEHKTTCNPAEEFEEYQLIFVYQNHNFFTKRINIDVNERNIGHCLLLNQTCHEYSSDIYKFSLGELSGKRILTLTIKNVSRNTYTSDLRFLAWVEDRLLENRLDCTATVFSNAKGFSCESNISENGVNFVCSTKRIYPQGRCNFYFNNTLNILHMEEKNEEIQGTPTYFTSVCTLLLPRSSLIPGRYDVNVTMFPNVTNSDRDVQYGTSYNLFIALEKPRVTLVDCNDDVKRGNKVNCICKSSNNTTNDVIVLYELGGKEIRLSQSSSVAVDAKMLDTGFICRAKHILGWESDPVFYKPEPHESNRNSMILISSFASGGVLVITSIIVVCCLLKRKVLIKKTVGNASLDHGYLDVSPYTDASMRLEISQLLTLTGGQIQELNSYSTLDNSMTGVKRMISPNAIYNTID